MLLCKEQLYEQNSSGQGEIPYRRWAEHSL